MSNKQPPPPPPFFISASRRSSATRPPPPPPVPHALRIVEDKIAQPSVYVISDADSMWSKEEELGLLNSFSFSGPSVALSDLLLRDPARRVFYSSFLPVKSLDNVEARTLLSAVRTRDRRSRDISLPALNIHTQDDSFETEDRLSTNSNGAEASPLLRHIEALLPPLHSQRMRMVKERRRHERQIEKRNAPPPIECSYASLVPLHQRYLAITPTMQQAKLREDQFRRHANKLSLEDGQSLGWVEDLRSMEERHIAWRASLTEKAAEIEKIWEEVTSEMAEKEQQQARREQELKSERNEVTSALTALDSWQEELERKTRDVARREERLAEFLKSFADPSKPG